VTVEHAYAKLTVSLRITGVRADGYHLLDAEMVTLDLADVLVFGSGDGLIVEDRVAEPGSPVPVDGGPGNLVRRALAAVGRSAAVRLIKHIPAGAGLGGGSADAAAVLRWSGRARPTGADLELALELGADVPFCVRGGRARVRGVGEVVEPLACRSGEPFTLLTPPLAVSTVTAYRAWDRLGGTAGGGPNDLEAAALAVEPGLRTWRERLGEATGQTPVLAGSGSTWWVRGAYPDVEGAVVAHSVCPG